MLRLGLAARIAMIVIIALTTAWIVAIALVYRSYDQEGESARPSPRQIAALVELIERIPREQRPLALAAVASRVFDARLQADRAPDGAASEGRPVDETLLQAYAAALEGRPLAIVFAVPAERRFPRLFAITTNALEFRIALRTGETLFINTRSPLPVSRLGLPVGFGAGLFGTLIAFLALVIMHRETRPLARLSAAVDRMDLAGTPVILPQARASAPEIQALIAAFNRLQARLAQLLRARMAMLGGISHDVRTFATRLRLRVDRIPEGAERDRAINDISDMIRLLDDALLASRAGAGELAQELVELDDVVRIEVEDRRAAGAPVELQVAPGAAGATILGDRLALRRIVSNLVDNALKYGHAAHLGIAIDSQSLVLTVDDEGTGIPPDLREFLLEPFVRLETSRNRQTGGAGLGLAIVRNLVEAHGGTLGIGDAASGGARITLLLPMFRPL
ncbi:sensor histidine kinase [Taklimakanibacter lacteus]|uniref:sensor histidine kinase n=1 Tax=Taklimakanibacter lacteus TaxID=2268456 RepID=UPI000E673435